MSIPILVCVPPVPIFLLFIIAPMLEVSVIAVCLDFPSLVVNYFIVIPAMIVTMIFIEHVGSRNTTGKSQGKTNVAVNSIERR
jgi:hypothetical protein